VDGRRAKCELCWLEPELLRKEGEIEAEESGVARADVPRYKPDIVGTSASMRAKQALWRGTKLSGVQTRAPISPTGFFLWRIVFSMQLGYAAAIWGPVSEAGGVV
jgi:hypothetical protein